MSFTLISILALLALPFSSATPLSPLRKRYYYAPSILGSLLSLGFLLFWLCICIWYMRYRRLNRPISYFDRFPYLFGTQAQQPQQPTVVVVNNLNGPGGPQEYGAYGHGHGYGPGGVNGQGWQQGFSNGGQVPYGGGAFQAGGRVASPAPAYRGP